MINDLKIQLISEYCKAILILLIFSIFSDRQTFIKVPKSKTASIFSDRQTFIKVPKSKTAYSREDILVPEEKEIICDKFLALELINNLKTPVTYNDGLQLM